MDLVGGHEAFCLVRRIPLFFFFSFLTGEDCGIWMAQVGTLIIISDKGLTSERVGNL